MLEVDQAILAPEWLFQRPNITQVIKLSFELGPAIVARNGQSCLLRVDMTRALALESKFICPRRLICICYPVTHIIWHNTRILASRVTLSELL